MADALQAVMKAPNDAIHREISILEARVRRAASDCEHLVVAIRCCADALHVLERTPTREVGPEIRGPLISADPFCVPLEDSHD